MTKLDSRRDVAKGTIGALGIAFDLATPFLRKARAHWGVSRNEASRYFVGDELVPEPTWGWTHGITINRSMADVWPWVAQIGQSKAGFYSYQWLENLAGCDILNADTIHPDWTKLQIGDEFYLHPKAPPLYVVDADPGCYFLVSSKNPDPAFKPIHVEADLEGVVVSWLFSLEPLGEDRCRLISRYRVKHGPNWKQWLQFGPWTTESVGFVMDRGMLLGIKKRAEKFVLPYRPRAVVVG